jgi:hypothetical protein
MAAELKTLKDLAKERSPKDMRDECTKAFTDLRSYYNELQSIYRYMMPWRQSTIERAPEGGGTTEGQSFADYIFDATGVSAAANYAGTMLADWMPQHQEFLKLAPGPFIPDGAEKDQLALGLEKLTAMVHAVSARPQITALEMFYDHFGGTGAMFLGKGDKRTIVNSAAVPINELALRNGPWGDPWFHFWKRKYPHRDLPALWPDGKVSDDLARAIREKPTDLCEIVQHTYYDAPANKWRLVVWACTDKEEAPPIWEEEFDTCPWMTPRMFVMPGETMGRGLAHLALPFVKTANRGRELALKAAILAILGIWLQRNDHVFNPKTAVFEPGAMWKVATTGGPLGPSLARLPVPQDFDISTVVMQEERDQIRRVLLDDELPDEQDPVRSATEVAGRLRRYQRRRGGTGARLPHELHTPYARRVIEILISHGLVKDRVDIDEIVTRCIVTAPAAAAQKTDKVEAWVSYVQIIAMLFGPQAAMLMTKIQAIPEMGRNLGLPEHLLPQKDDLEKIEQALKTAAAQQAAMAEQANAKPQAPGAQLVNGGAM